MSNRNDYILKHSVDARWFLALKKIKRPLLLNSYLISAEVLEREKQKVIESSSYNPVFEYQNLDGLAVKNAKESLLNLRKELWQEEPNQSIREAYLDKIDECLQEMDMLLATTDGRWEDFTYFNQMKYGQMRPEIVSKRIHSLQEKLELFQKVILDKNKTLTFPTISTVKYAKKVFSSGPDLNDLNSTYSSEDIQELWQNEIAKFADGWKVIVSDSCLYIMVNNKRRKILLPKNLILDQIKMHELFVHEVGIHVYRREMGKKTKLQLLSIGLAEYQKAEEGMALVREQLVKEKYSHYSGFDKYLALMYALGEIDGEKKDFQQTFVMLKNYYEQRALKKHSKDYAQKTALHRAWGSSVRIFRGGQPSLPGCCFMRDKIYREGNIYIWELLEKSPEFFNDVYLGKFNPGNKKQRELVSKFK